jgi:septal ring factor EnvC (AmiA/AmiB activator)
LPHVRRRSILARTVLAVVVASALLSPTASDAQGKPPPNPAATKKKLDDVRAQRGRVTLDVDALQAKDADVKTAVQKLSANVDTQQANLDEAEREADDADADLAAASKAVVAGQARIDALDKATDDLVVEAYVNPPSDDALEPFRADSLTDSAVKQALVDLESDSDADMLDQLRKAREDLAVDQADKADAAAAAEQKRADASSALADVQNALDQQQKFQADLEDRLDDRLAEAESLKSVDKKLAAQLVREQAEVAAQIRAMKAAAEAQRRAEAAALARAAAADRAAGRRVRSIPSGGGGGGGGFVASSVIRPVPGGLASVGCPTGGSITVAGSIAHSVQGLLNLAGSQGVGLCGSGYRSTASQIALRRAHCGTSPYAIYQMPSSDCHPPTARPGRSQHERGLAIDFDCNGGGAIRHGNECWNFLVANANSYGLYNLPSEPWHWSTTGR